MLYVGRSVRSADGVIARSFGYDGGLSISWIREKAREKLVNEQFRGNYCLQIGHAFDILVSLFKILAKHVVQMLCPHPIFLGFLAS